MDPLAAVVEAGGEHVPPLMERLEEVLQDAAGYDTDVARHASETIAAGGKRMRPLLVFVTAGPYAPDTESLVRAAAAVELIHSATLVHDDVLDGSDLRRGRPTVFAAAGRLMATSTGDLLFSRAFALAARNGSPEEVQALSAATSGLALGELMQREDAWNPAVTLDRYERRCELKTARLFEAACRLGSLESGRRAVELADFGRSIGLAFQLLDDILDVTGPPERTGKPRGADLLDGTVTLPFILARARDAQLSAIDPREITTAERAAEVADAIEATGALVEARQRAMALVSEAKEALPGPGDPRRTALELVADAVVERYA